MRIPVSVEEFTPEWLTDALTRGGSLIEGRVSRVATSTVGEGVGLVGSLARLALTYDGAAPGAPRSLVAKFPSATEQNRELGRLFRFYEREYRFYTGLASTVPVRAPVAYFADLNEETGDSVLLLEDLQYAELCDQLAPPPDTDLMIIIDRAADLHSTFWGRGDEEPVQWVPAFTDPMNEGGVATFQMSWEPFVEKFEHTLNPRMKVLGESFPERMPGFMERLAQPPTTLVHADYRLDNLFFDRSSGGDPLRVIDWQLIGMARGPYDVGYFMAQSVEPERRVRLEMDLLARYHDRLKKNGIEGYSTEECLEDYKLAILLSMAIPVSAGGAMDLANDRGYSLIEAAAIRAFAAIEHLDADRM